MRYQIQFFDAETRETTVIGSPIETLDAAERKVKKLYSDRIRIGGLNLVTIIEKDSGSVMRVYSVN